MLQSLTELYNIVVEGVIKRRYKLYLHYLHVYTVQVHVNAHTIAAVKGKKTKKKIVILHLYCSYSVASTKNERKKWLAIPDADADASHH